MKDNELATVPFYAFESLQARNDRTHRRLITAFIISMVVNIGLTAIVARNGSQEH